MSRSSLDLDELVEFWTLLDVELEQVGAKRGAARLGFAVLLKYFTRHGRFPRGRSELPDAAVEFVAGQVGVPAAELGFYEWAGRTVEAHRAQIRKHLGFRECSVEDAEKLTAWLARQVCEAERSRDRVRDALLARCRAERIEPPAVARVERVVGSALRRAEKTLTERIAARLSAVTADRIHALVGEGVPDEPDLGDVGDRRRASGTTLLAYIKDRPGNVSLESMLIEIDRLLAVGGVELPGDLFADVARKVVSGWRARSAVEWPSHLREHPPELRLTLLAALLFERERRSPTRWSTC